MSVSYRGSDNLKILVVSYLTWSHKCFDYKYCAARKRKCTPKVSYFLEIMQQKVGDQRLALQLTHLTTTQPKFASRIAACIHKKVP